MWLEAMHVGTLEVCFASEIALDECAGDTSEVSHIVGKVVSSVNPYVLSVPNESIDVIHAVAVQITHCRIQALDACLKLHECFDLVIVLWHHFPNVGVSYG